MTDSTTQRIDKLFRDRTEAGRVLSNYLKDYADRSDAFLLGLPRGGFVVAYEVASALSLPLDVLVVRKLGVPGHEELAMGAIAEGGFQVINQLIVHKMNIDQSAIEQVVSRERKILDDRLKLYRGDRAPLEIRGQTIILVDDGLATGATMEVAVQVVRTQEPTQVVVAVPVAPLATCANLAPKVDKLVCVNSAQEFLSVSSFYSNFSEIKDDEVQALLAKTNDR